MSITEILFWALSVIAFLSALIMITSKNPVYSVLALIITFFCISGHYILLNAQFLAIVNFIVYMGAIMVLFLFVLMLLNLNKDTEPLKSNLVKGIGVVAAMCLLVTVAGSLRLLEVSQPLVLKNPEIGLVENLGKVLFSDFLLPFEISSILLLTAMVGAVLLAKNESKKV